MSIYLLLFTVTTPIGESCCSLTQHNLCTVYFSPSRHPSGSRTCHPLTQHNPCISLQVPLLFTVTPPVGGSYMSPTHSTQPLDHSPNTITFHPHATHGGVVHVTHSLNTASTSPNTFYFLPSRHPSGSRTCHPLTHHNLYISKYLLLFTITPPIGESYTSPTHSTQPLHLHRSFIFHRHATRRRVVCATHTLNTASTSLLLFPVTPPVGEPCHSRAVPMTLHNPQWPRDVLGTSGRGWPFTQLTAR